MIRRSFGLTALSSLLTIAASLAQTGDPQENRHRRRAFSGLNVHEWGMDEPTAPRREFTFARLVYSEGWGWRYGSWATDAPKADVTFLAGINYIVYSMTH